MQQPVFKQILVGIIFVVSLNGTLLQAAQPDQRRFFCGVVQGKFTTLVRTSQNLVPLIFWNSGYFAESGWTNQKRCVEVSQRFQRYHDRGQLDYIRTGVVNRYPVLCVRKCSNTEVLITLKPGSDPQQTLEELLSLRDRSSNVPLELSADQALYYDATGELYVDVDKLINILEPVSERDVTSINSSVPEPKKSQPSSEPLF